MTSRTSRVAAGDGVTDPVDATVYRAWADGDQVALILEWTGNGYTGEDCWIQADEGSFRPLSEAE